MASPHVPRVEPFIAPETKMREFTLRAVLTGAFLGLIFGASSLYLVLKVGLTVSASIPVAVISLAIFRGLSKVGLRDATILEHNITQTAGSAGESIAFGIGATMPAIMILGFDLQLVNVMIVAVMGGLLGILMMIPLRRALIVNEHGILKYPEGTACAAVLRTGASAEDRAAASPAAQAELRAAEAAGLGKAPGAHAIFGGFGVGLIYTTLNLGLRAWKDISEKIFGAPFKAGSVSIEVSPALLGVGYIIGPYIGGLMAGGGVLAYLVLIPLIKFFGDQLSGPLMPATIPISQMGPDDIHRSYVLYIGAGAVAAGGIISLFEAVPTIWRGIKGGMKNLSDLRGNKGPAKENARTDRDLPLTFVGIGIVVLIAGITMMSSLHMNLLGALLIVAFGFLFVTVSSRLTGEIGSSSNPISGMTVATLLFTCLIFWVVGWKGNGYYVTALSVGAIVCIAASNGGTTSQDLKTGHLLGSTPKFQQYAILIGALGSALLLGPMLLLLNESQTVYVPIAQVAPAGLHTDASRLTKLEKIVGPQASSDRNTYHVWNKTDDLGAPKGRYLVNDQGNAVWLVDPGINGTHNVRPDGSTVTKFVAPKATLMAEIIQGILGNQLPWALVLLGVMIAVTLQMSFVPALAFAVGVYLPLSSSTPIFAGGLIRWLVDRKQRQKPECAALSAEEFSAESDKSPGVLLASGYIAGGAIAGTLTAIMPMCFFDTDTAIAKWSAAHNPFFGGSWADALTLLPFAALCFFLYGVGREIWLSPKRH